MIVWVLDVVGYDARGGNAEVFATAEAAKASMPNVVWVPNGRGGWAEDLPSGSMGDQCIINPHEVRT